MTRRFTIGVLVLAQVFLLTFGALAAAERWASLPLNDDDMYALLILGSDQGPPRPGSVLNGRADAIQLLVIDAERENVTIISIPRDSYVPVTGMGTTKINAMLTRGPDNAVATVESLTGIQIDDWLVTGFDAVIRGVDEFGGIHVDVEQRLLDNQAQTDLQPGYQRLTGWSALAYTRDRHSRANGDVGRSTAQATLLRGTHRELIADATSPARLVDFLSTLRRHTVSSIGTDRLIRLAVLALRIDPDNVTQVTLPGRNGFAGDAAVYRLSDGAFSIFEDVREDGRLTPSEG